MMDTKYPHYDWGLCKNEAEKIIDSLENRLIHTISRPIIKIIQKAFLEHFDFDIEKSLDEYYDQIIFGYCFTPPIDDEDWGR